MHEDFAYACAVSEVLQVSGLALNITVLWLLLLHDANETHMM